MRVQKVVYFLDLLAAVSCARVHLPRLPDGRLDVQQLVTWADDGIQADCLLMPGSSVCTLGRDVIAVARSAGQNPLELRMALVDFVSRFPVIKPYVAWLIADLS